MGTSRQLTPEQAVTAFTHLSAVIGRLIQSGIDTDAYCRSRDNAPGENAPTERRQSAELDHHAGLTR